MIFIKLYSDINIKDLELLGTGTQGKVYKIDDEICIKIFKKKKDCKEEIESLVLAQNDSHFPRLYSYGDNFIIREFISGIVLDEYLKKHKLTPQLINNLIGLYEAMINVRFNRLDAAIFHIFISTMGELKLIDTAKSLRKKTTIPNLLISGLVDLGFKKDLFDYLLQNRPDLYKVWIHYSKINYKKIN